MVFVDLSIQNPKLRGTEESLLIRMAYQDRDLQKHLDSILIVNAKRCFQLSGLRLVLHQSKNLKIIIKYRSVREQTAHNKLLNTDESQSL